jgi:hypothetical protein
LNESEGSRSLKDPLVLGLMRGACHLCQQWTIRNRCRARRSAARVILIFGFRRLFHKLISESAPFRCGRVEPEWARSVSGLSVCSVRHCPFALAPMTLSGFIAEWIELASVCPLGLNPGPDISAEVLAGSSCSCMLRVACSSIPQPWSAGHRWWPLGVDLSRAWRRGPASRWVVSWLW